MDIHVLNGDALREKFISDGEVVVCREALIEGPVDADDEVAFWNMRARHLCGEEELSTYSNFVKAEFDKLSRVNPASSIHLWFEHDLFCQVNMWFVLYFLRIRGMMNKIYRVMPPLNMENKWDGFGALDEKEILACLRERKLFTSEDALLGEKLWTAYCENDLTELAFVGNSTSECFPHLREVCQAQIDRQGDHNGRPQKKLAEILKRGTTNFSEIFREFGKTEGIYGFGDIQVKKMLDAIQS